MGYYENTKEGDEQGAISEWNEGNFKNLRLHEGNEMINIGKTDPFGLAEDNIKWNYQVWKSGIDILYGEGQSKYTKDEIDYIKIIKNVVERHIRLNPPFKTVLTHRICEKQVCYKPLVKNQGTIQEMLETYEENVKVLNDQHGLSTRNKEIEDKGRAVLN